jgi:CRP-like cAMP-binding protein
MLKWETPPSGAGDAAPGAPDAPHRTAPGLSRLNTALGHRRCAAGETIYAEGDAAERIYEVVGGLVRTVRTTRDGRRMVEAFFVPGDVFGLTGECAHASTAEAVVRSRVSHCERTSAQSSAFTDRDAAAALWSWMARNVERAAARGPLLARGDAREKVQGFLLEMADRLNAGQRVELAMSRYDIADYLGLSSETVSRTFTALRARGLIALEGRTVVMLEPMAQRRADRADLRL